LVAGITFLINETIVPWASEKANALQIEVKREIDESKVAKEINRTVKFKDGGLGMLSAVDFSLVNQTLTKASLVVYNKEFLPVWWLQADGLRYYGPRDWRIEGQAKLISADGTQMVTLEEGAWPQQVENPDITPRNLFAGFATDLDAFNMVQIREEIERLKRDPKPDMRQVLNLEFGYWNKIALPLGAVVFALLGAPLGIRNQRTGAGSGFALSIGLTFGYLMLANFMAVYSRGGALPPFVASFLPVAIGMVGAAVAIWRKNG
jgi:lipopolysaccharide export system permease protein